MSTDVVEKVIESLTQERDKCEAAISALQAARVTGTNGTNGNAHHHTIVRRRIHGQKNREARQPRENPKDSKASGKPKRSVNPPGALRAAIHKSIGRRKTPISLHEITDRVLETGYKCTSRKNLYSSIFMTAKSDPALKKTKDGIVLLKGAANGTGRAKQKDRLRKLVS